MSTTSSPKGHRPHVKIVGAGIIGLSCAWELMKRGARVTLCEKAWPPRGASWAAAGMLAPAYEAAAEPDAHPALFDLCRESAALWPEFATELERESGVHIGYSAGPTLAVARSEEQLVQLNGLRDALSLRHVSYRVLSARNIADEAPFLCSGIDHAVSIASDGQVDNRAVLTALGSICRKAGLEIQTAADIDADIVLRTIGVSDPQTRPVKGQAIAFQPFSDAPDQVVRCGSLYIVPKPDRVIVGATVEAGKNDIVVDPHVPDQLQDAAARICPAIAEQMPIEHWAGVRPQTTDHAPIIGSQGKDTFLATGHYRNGILLAPITARLIADMVLTDEVSELAAQFSPRRFMPATA